MEQKHTVEALRALADDIRLSVVRALARSEQPLASCDIVGQCERLGKMTQPTMSHHLNKLVDAGVLTEEKIGTQKRYELNVEYLASIGVDVTKL